MNNYVNTSLLASKHSLRIHSKNTHKHNISINTIKTFIFYQESINILSYSSFDYEISTETLTKQILLDNKRLFLPKIINNTMQFFMVNDLNNLKIGSYGIKEPIIKSSIPFKLQEKTLLIAPTLATTKEGYRLGHGSGYYDKFLREYINNKKLTSLALVDNRFDYALFPQENHDIPFHYVLSNMEIRKCFD